MTDFLLFFSKVYFGLEVYKWLGILASFATISGFLVAYFRKQAHTGNSGIINKTKGNGNTTINFQNKP